MEIVCLTIHSGIVSVAAAIYPTDEDAARVIIVINTRAHTTRAVLIHICAIGLSLWICAQKARCNCINPGHKKPCAASEKKSILKDNV